nr:ankyrin repeat domain-containing protein [uncultured Roseateles sp.]
MRYPLLLITTLLGLLLCGPARAAGYAELAAAVRAGDTPAVEQLLKTGVAVEPPAGSSAPLLIAASRGHHAIARLLLARGAEPNPRFAAYYNATPLMLAVNQHDVEMSRLLLDAGAQVNLVDSYGDPALNWAVFYGDMAQIELLLAHKADASLVGHGNALEVAMRRGHPAAVERLLDYTGQRLVLSAAHTKLVQAIQQGDGAAVRLALANGASPDALDASGRPVLALAARLGQLDALRALLDADAAVNSVDAIGFTALMEAAREGRVAACELLLNKGAALNQQALPRGLALTALHLAVAGGRLEAVRLLAKHGADLEAADSEQATPIMWTGEKDPIRQLLLELGAKPPTAKAG